MTICGPNNQQVTAGQLAQYMQNAGFPTAVIPTGVAVAMGESSLQTGNCNLSDPNGGSFGLWQINGTHFSSGATTQACAFDAQCATNYAFQLWSTQGWQPWGAYTNGSYKSYLDPSGNVNLPTGTGAGQPGVFAGTSLQQIGLNNPLNQISAFLSSLTALEQWLQDPIRIIKLIFGIILITVGIMMLVDPKGEIPKDAAKAVGEGAMVA